MTDEPHAATMRVEEAGVLLLAISRRSAYRAASSGDISPIRIGRRILFPPPCSTARSAIYPAHGSTGDAPTREASEEHSESRYGRLANAVGKRARDQ